MDDKIYVNQSLVITLNMMDDMPNILDKHISYQNPKGVKGIFNATISGQNLVSEIPAGVLNLPGTWKLQGWAKGIGWEMPGRTVLMTIHKLFT
jgi:hypothetical protein